MSATSKGWPWRGRPLRSRFPAARAGEPPLARWVPDAGGAAVRGDLETKHVAAVVERRAVARMHGRVHGIDAWSQGGRWNVERDSPFAGEVLRQQAVDIGVRPEDRGAG